MRALTFGIDNRALLSEDGHSKRWNSRMGAYVDRLDVIVEMREKGNFSEKWIADNVRIIPIYVPHPAIYSFIAYRKALEEHKKNRYDLVTTEEPFRTGFAGWLFKRKTGVALSIEYHNDTFNNIEWINERPVSHRIYIVMGKIALSAAESIRCVNWKNYAEIRNICNNEPAKLMEVIPVPTEFYNHEKHGQKAKEIRHEIIKNVTDVIILFVGRLVAIKKVDELLRIFSGIRSTHKNAYLVIVGDGLDHKRLRKLVDEIGNERIIFKGYIPEDDVLAYFGASDIFVNPAHIEPYGKVYIEAMSAGKPVVTTNGAGAVEDKLCINNENSLVVEPGSLNELRGAIDRLIVDKELRKKLGENALKIVRQKFDYENSLRVMTDFFKRTIDRQKEKLQV